MIFVLAEALLTKVAQKNPGPQSQIEFATVFIGN
jgi:hypothetical protein